MNIPPVDFIAHGPAGSGYYYPVADVPVWLAKKKRPAVADSGLRLPLERLPAASLVIQTRLNRPGRGDTPLPRDGFKEGCGKTL
jgi:hypothetical protein